jgi:hypothetical protein
MVTVLVRPWEVRGLVEEWLSALVEAGPPPV